MSQTRQIARLKTLDQYKDQLLASVTHELRTPLNCIIPMINDVIIDPAIPEATKDLSLKPALNSAQLLMNLINDILDYSRHKRNKLTLNFEEFDLYDKIMEIYRLFEIQCKHKGVQFLLDLSSTVPRMIYSDKNRLGQVIINFLSNALKFTSRGSITLSVEKSSVEDSLIFKVSDTGLGIKREHLINLFTEFGKIDAAEHNSLNPHGVGLGLMISNQLVALLGGKTGIKVNSTYGEGSEFLFEIPIRTRQSEMHQIIIEIPFKLQRHPNLIAQPCQCQRILTVDDNDYNQMVIERMLKKLQFEVVKAFNGADALKIMKDPYKAGLQPCKMATCLYFKLILTDLQMPVLDGLQLIREVRRLPGEIGKVPMILVSATGEEAQVKEGFDAGMNDFLCKPMTEPLLKERLNTYCTS
eukprot:TRINITY_DN3658_c0_g3_i3.p1 TRINITY_DN3658_c0_g3~~TRINITY_DN3658_c0_g3_i3.p1  ORF type:complete len:412 (-),score=32.73 TRINITY_DN3658_c0_g3_i3:120-1355(-)